jgi:NAD(P)H-nitrite reductase large subunit
VTLRLSLNWLRVSGGSSFQLDRQGMATGTLSVDTADDVVVCHCLGITKSQIRAALEDGTAECLRTVMQQTGAGTGCTACHRTIQRLLIARHGQGCDMQAHDRQVQCDGSSSSPTCVIK